MRHSSSPWRTLGAGCSILSISILGLVLFDGNFPVGGEGFISRVSLWLLLPMGLFVIVLSILTILRGEPKPYTEEEIAEAEAALDALYRVEPQAEHAPPQLEKPIPYKCLADPAPESPQAPKPKCCMLQILFVAIEQEIVWIAGVLFGFLSGVFPDCKSYRLSQYLRVHRLLGGIAYSEVLAMGRGKKPVSAALQGKISQEDIALYAFITNTSARRGMRSLFGWLLLSIVIVSGLDPLLLIGVNMVLGLYGLTKLVHGIMETTP